MLLTAVAFAVALAFARVFAFACAFACAFAIADADDGSDDCAVAPVDVLVDDPAPGPLFQYELWSPLALSQRSHNSSLHLHPQNGFPQSAHAPPGLQLSFSFFFKLFFLLMMV